MISKTESDVRRLEYPVLAGQQATGGEEEPRLNMPDRIRELESKLAERERQFAAMLEGTRQEAQEKGKQMAAEERASWREECSGQFRAAGVQVCCGSQAF